MRAYGAPECALGSLGMRSIREIEDPGLEILCENSENKTSAAKAVLIFRHSRHN